MLELKSSAKKTNRRVFADPLSSKPEEPKQRRMMVVALSLLLVALGIVLFRDRDFWFPETQEAEEQTQSATPASVATSSQPMAAKPPAPAPAHKKSHSTKPQPQAATPSATAPADESTTPVIARTVLPPLEVEVVAGDTHRSIRPGSNSVRVDLQPAAPSQEVAEAPVPGDATGTAASLTTNAAERVQISADTAEVVSRPVKPGYPLLARQMKVQGSVILQALIGRDGLIQDLRVLSGPPILASAAQEAVKQWHFKPHYLGVDAVETQAKITVNFTISTN